MDINENIVPSRSSLLGARLGKKKEWDLFKVGLNFPINWADVEKRRNEVVMVTISNLYKQTCGQWHLG